MQYRITAIFVIGAVLASANAWACGESLYRVGKGVSYRAYSAPLPANLLVYANSERAKEIAAELARAGHGVHLVADSAQLESELRKGGYDVVIAPDTERGTIESMSSTGSRYLAVGSGEGAKLAPDDDIKRYLKAIHKALKQKA